MKNTGKRIFFIDPQSLRNLAIYDYSLQSHFPNGVHYFCSCHYDYQKHENINYHYVFKYNHLENNVLKALSYLWSYLIILFYILRLRPNIIHVQWFRIPVFDYYFYKTAKHLVPFKLIYTAHNILPHDTGDKYKAIYSKIYKLTDHIIAHTKETQNKLNEIFNVSLNNITVIRHGYLKTGVSNNVDTNYQPEYQKKLDGKLVFSAVGYQYDYKGSDIIAKAWEEYEELNQNKNIVLLIAGMNKGVDFSAIENYDNVIIDDRRIPNEEFHQILLDTDILLLPYKRISQSGILLSAISASIPVVVTKLGGLTEPFEVADIGWIIDNADAESLGKQLTYLANNVQEVREKKNNEKIWQAARDFYSWDEISQKTVDLYFSL